MKKSSLISQSAFAPVHLLFFLFVFFLYFSRFFAFGWLAARDFRWFLRQMEEVKIGSARNSVVTCFLSTSRSRSPRRESRETKNMYIRCTYEGPWLIAGTHTAQTYTITYFYSILLFISTIWFFLSFLFRAPKSEKNKLIGEQEKSENQSQSSWRLESCCNRN